MSLSKRIKSIIIISLLSILVVGAYYIVSYFISDEETDEYYSFTEEEIEILKETEKIDIYMFKPEFMFYETSTENTEEEEKFSIPSPSKVGENLGTSLREFIIKGNVAEDTGERADEYATVINGFMKSLSEVSSKINYYHDENGSFSEKYNITGDYIIFDKDGEITKVAYDDFFVTLEDGTKYAFDRQKVINIINSINGREEKNVHSLVALKGYDTDGDTVSTITNTPFVFPPITSRYDVQVLNVYNRNGGFRVYQDETTQNFYFKDALTLDYNSELFSTALMSAIYMLSTGKVESPVSLAEYGLDDEKNATAVVQIYMKGENSPSHQVIIGNKTVDGTGYYAKYYNKDHIYIISSDIENGLLLPAQDFFQKSIVHTVTSVEGVYSIDDIKVNFLTEDKELNVVLMEDEDDDGSQVYSIWKIISPQELIPTGKEFGNPNSSAFTEFIQSAATLTSEKIVEYKMTDVPISESAAWDIISEEVLANYIQNRIVSDGKDRSEIEGFSAETLEKYGLLNPRLEVSYSYPVEASNGEEYKIFSRVMISELNEDGEYYAYSYLYTFNSKGELTEIQCTGCITTLSKDNVTWLEWGVMDFNNKFLYKNYVYNVDWLEVESNGEIYRFNVDASEEDEEVYAVTLVHNGSSQSIEPMNFKLMYSSVLLIYMVDNYEIANEEPQMMCRITIHARGGSTEMIFYRVTNTKAYYTLNGEGKHYVKVSTVFNFLSKYNRVINGETLSRDDFGI